MPTVVRHQRPAQILCAAAAGFLFALAAPGSAAAAPSTPVPSTPVPSTPVPSTPVPSTPVPSAPCYNGIAPLNPYVDNCAIPNRPPHILGAAPDQTAILNCNVGGGAWRAVCLSQYVNGGNYGGYPGIVLGIGGR